MSVGAMDDLCLFFLLVPLHPSLILDSVSNSSTHQALNYVYLFGYHSLRVFLFSPLTLYRLIAQSVPNATTALPPFFYLLHRSFQRQ
jgi:hypothetical protein